MHVHDYIGDSRPKLYSELHAHHTQACNVFCSSQKYSLLPLDSWYLHQ
jgi:hypothetical protein